MNKSDERLKLEEQYAVLKESGLTDERLLSFIGSLFALLDKADARTDELEDRVTKLEDFTDIISMDLFDIQSVLLKKLKIEKLQNLENINPAELWSGGDDEDDEDCCDDDCDCCHDDCEDEDDADVEDGDDDSEYNFVRCPYCNTLIFSDDNTEKLTCPFCNEAFSKNDAE